MITAGRTTAAVCGKNTANSCPRHHCGFLFATESPIVTAHTLSNKSQIGDSTKTNISVVFSKLSGPVFGTVNDSYSPQEPSKLAAIAMNANITATRNLVSCDHRKGGFFAADGP